MRHIVRKKIVLSLLLLLALPVAAHAIPAITCHCFTERGYDAAKPAAADAYFLATTQNSFFASVFNTDKKSIVIKKQQGTSSDDLWIAHWVALKSGTLPEDLLQARRQSDAWKKVVVSLRLTPKALGNRFSNALNANAPAGRLAEAVVDEIFITEQLLGEGELAALRKAGAGNQELILATVIAARTRQPAKQLYLEVKAGTRSWGTLLAAAKMDPKNMPQEIAASVKLHPL